MANVASYEGQSEYEIKSAMTGQQLFDQVLAQYRITSAVPLFGLQFTDKKDCQAFLKLEKKILSQDVKKENPMQFLFSAKFFPESVNEELTDPVIQRLFWQQIRHGISKDDIYCPPELCVLFAAQSMQALFGDISEAGVVNPQNELPPRVLEQHGFSITQWEDRIKNAWLSLKGTKQRDAIMDYLNIAQDLEQYGITYFEVTNKKGTKMFLGVHNMGMDIYEANNQVTPRLGFPWAEIRNISFNDKKFKIQMVNKDAPDFKFYSTRFKINKRILALCVGNHKLFVGRRRAAASGHGGEDRAAFEAKLRRTKEHLMAIRMDLESVKDRTKMTKADMEHEQNERTGMDKFKTMKKAQSGDASRRVKSFEDMEDADC